MGKYKRLEEDVKLKNIYTYNVTASKMVKEGKNVYGASSNG